MKKIWFITGTSSGLGRSLADAVLSNGDTVVATARDLHKNQDLVERYGDQIFSVQLDVTDEKQIHKVVNDAAARFGRIDVLVNNAGFGITGATEAFTQAQFRSQIETNLLAPIAVCRAVLPYMRAQRSGKIFNISSIGGRVASIGLAMYQSAKFGLSGFSEALSKEVAPLGIKVTSIEPGGMQTNWGGSSMTFAEPVEGYESTVDVRVEFFKSGKFVPKSDPVKVAKVIIELSDESEPPIHLVLGSDAAAILEQANSLRQEEYQKWLPVTLSTDADLQQL
jgi:NAD(P)-dependent dehydrogenase (short-subunit alcohol dehydrogenase family)